MKNSLFFNTKNFIFQQVRDPERCKTTPEDSAEVAETDSQPTNPDAPVDAAQQEGAALLKREQLFLKKIGRVPRRVEALERLSLDNFDVRVERMFEMRLKKGSPEVDKSVAMQRELMERINEPKVKVGGAWSPAEQANNAESGEWKNELKEWEKEFRKNPIITGMSAKDVAEIDPKEVARVTEIPPLIHLTYKGLVNEEIKKTHPHLGDWPASKIMAEIEADKRWAQYFPFRNYETMQQEGHLEFQLRGDISIADLQALDREIEDKIKEANSTKGITVRTTVVDY